MPLPHCWLKQETADGRIGSAGALADMDSGDRSTAEHLGELFRQIEPIGHIEDGPRSEDAGYARFAWTDEEAWLRVWFAAHLQRRGFSLRVDHGGNQWAWLGEPSADSPGMAVGSHLDSVPGGGAFDGPLGVLGAIAAYDRLHAAGWRPSCPIAIVNFHDEEGARFAIACFGSRVVTGLLDGSRALERNDADGIGVRDALAAFAPKLDALRREMTRWHAQAAEGSTSDRYAQALAGFSDDEIAAAVNASRAPVDQRADPELLQCVTACVELHVEQGSAQRDLGAPVAVAEAIWPHGRWRVCIQGESNHAGTTPVDRRHDPMLVFARIVEAVRDLSVTSRVRATVGRIQVVPNGVNVIASTVTCWVDCRAESESAVSSVIDELRARARSGGFGEGCRIDITRESWTGRTSFSAELRDCLTASTAAAARSALPATSGADGRGEAQAAVVPLIGTAAGHDAGILQETGHASGMLFVRNNTGASHTPAEFATLSDSVQGVKALAQAMQDVSARIAQGWRPRS